MLRNELLISGFHSDGSQVLAFWVQHGIVVTILLKIDLCHLGEYIKRN